MFVLDTNVVSELRKARKADPNLVAWASTTPLDNMFVSVISIFELEIGTLRIERRDAAQGSILRAWLNDHVIPTFAGRILVIDAAIAQRCASLHVPDRREYRDALIAATALVHGMTIVTRNVSDFAATGVAVIDPWRPPMRS